MIEPDSPAPATFDVVACLRVAQDRWRAYVEGWQSWSPAAVYGPGVPPLLPEEGWQHTMRYRPGTSLERSSLQGEGLVVIDPGDGSEAVAVVSTDLDDPATLVVEDAGDVVVVLAGGSVRSFTTATVEDALITVGNQLGDALDARTGRSPRVWCSWYRYFEQVTATDVRTAVADLDATGLPVDVVQIDDGWSTGLGDGVRPSDGFPDLASLVDEIRSSGRSAGLWLAPFLVGRQTQVAREHPEWLTGDAGHNWGQDLVGLDLLHPGVQDLLRDHFVALRALGVDYLKLDFLYGGCLPGNRRSRAEAVAAYRAGLGLIREVMGEDVFLVGCGAPLIPSIGLVDAMRVSPDTFHEGAQDGSRGMRGRLSTPARAWMHGRWWSNDPDCVVGHPGFALREAWAEVCREFGGLRSFSDRWEELDETGRTLVREVLEEPVPATFGAKVVGRGLEVSEAELRGRSNREDLG